MGTPGHNVLGAECVSCGARQLLAPVPSASGGGGGDSGHHGGLAAMIWEYSVRQRGISAGSHIEVGGHWMSQDSRIARFSERFTYPGPGDLAAILGIVPSITPNLSHLRPCRTCEERRGRVSVTTSSPGVARCDACSAWPCLCTEELVPRDARWKWCGPCLPASFIS